LIYTNEHNIPEVIVNAIVNDTYTRGESDISVTGLLQPPRIAVLRKKHEADLVADVSDEVWKLFGQVCHDLFERANKDKNNIETERRMFTEVDGWTISGQADIYEKNTKTLSDFKVTSVWSVIYADTKRDWEYQLNLYRYLYYLETNELPEKLQIIAICRDWNKRESQKRDNYPECQVVTINIPVWTVEQTKKFLQERLDIHKKAWSGYLSGETIPLCNDEERWKKEDKYAVHKGQNVRALKLFDNKEEAEKFANDLDMKTNIIFRQGESSRCSGNYCGVADFCDQFKEEAI
tara:strand:- start:2734 stop:3609 length:876 start_codon:yes stop_codon:yes gene_type:complete